MKRSLKPMPAMRSDAEAEKFVANADLSCYDLSGFKPMHFEIEPKAAVPSMRLPVALLEAIKAVSLRRRPDTLRAVDGTHTKDLEVERRKKS